MRSRRVTAALGTMAHWTSRRAPDIQGVQGGKACSAEEVDAGQIKHQPLAVAAWRSA